MQVVFPVTKELDDDRGGASEGDLVATAGRLLLPLQHHILSVIPDEKD